MKKIALYVDAFDPANQTQVALARKICARHYFNQVWFVTLEDEKGTSLYQRNTIINLQINPYRKLALISFKDSNLLNALKHLPKGNRYTLLWSDYCKQHYSKEDIPSRIALLDIDESQLAKQADIQAGDFKSLNKQSKRYIIESGIYATKIVQARVKPKRYQHSLSVAQLASQIAASNHLDGFKAWLMGVYHDIAKGMSDEQLAVYIQAFQPYEKDYDPPVWHQFVGAYILKYEYQMQDKQIINAVRHHCLGDSEEVYAKILFIADKLDPSRGYDSSKQIALALKDVDAAYLVVKKENEEYLEKTGVK